MIICILKYHQSQSKFQCANTYLRKSKKYSRNIEKVEMGDDEFKSLLDEEPVYDFENFVKLEILEESDDEPNVFSRKLDFESSEDEKSDAKNESVGQKLEKLTKKIGLR